MFKFLRFIPFVALLPALVLTACGAQLSTPGTGVQSSLPAVPNGENKGEGGAESALVTYSDAAQGFSIGHPGNWTQDPAFAPGVKFVGGDDWMTLAFVASPAGMDVMGYAKNNVAAVAAAFPGFNQLSLAASTEVNGAVVLGFTANGTSTVTGKSFTAHNEIYYIALKDGRIAVLTVVGPDNHYDREAIRDIALTLKVAK